MSQRINSNDARRLGNMLRDYEDGDLRKRRLQEPQYPVQTPINIVAACYETVTVGSGNTPEGNPEAINLANRPFMARRLIPVQNLVQWIRPVGFTSDAPEPEPDGMNVEYAGQHVTLFMANTPDEIREKLISIGLPDDIEVAGRGDTLNDSSVSNLIGWAVLFPGQPSDTLIYQLKWYDVPDAGVQRVVRVDNYPYWPTLDNVKIWKSVPSTDLIPNSSFVYASWLWGRGYVAQTWECVL